MAARYVVTGATSLVGRLVVPLLLARGAEVAVVMPAAADGSFGSLRARCGEAGQRLRRVRGDVAADRMGLDDAILEDLRGAVMFHVGADSDVGGDPAEVPGATVGATVNALAVADLIAAASFHHLSSTAVAGRRRGVFTESMFDEGQDFDDPEAQAAFEAERVVRERCSRPWRIYRSGLRIGAARTGEADRIDGLYYVFPLIRAMRDAAPQWVPFIGPEGGLLNLVPADFVAAALDHIAHHPAGDGGTFHLVDPHPLSLGDVLNTFCRAAHAPEFALRLDPRIGRMIPPAVKAGIASLPVVRGIRQQMLDRWEIPDGALARLRSPATFDATAAAEALRGSGIACPPLHSYAWRIWDHWERHLDPHLPTSANLRRVVGDRVVLVTGASSGIGRALVGALRGSGCTIVGVARNGDRLETLRAEAEREGSKVHVYPTDLSDPESCRGVCARILDDHGRIDVLVNNAGRSIRRSVAQSLDRFHDFERTMKLNYFGAIALIMSVLPGMRDRGSGHIINISSIGSQTFPPRFAAYVASKAALDAYSRCLAAEVAAEGIAVTTVHMPLVRTPMIAPTDIYRNFPTISADEAAGLIVRALLTRTPDVSTRLGVFGELIQAAAPDLHRLAMSSAFHLLPDSGDGSDASAGDKDSVSPDAYVLSQLMRGIHL